MKYLKIFGLISFIVVAVWSTLSLTNISSKIDQCQSVIKIKQDSINILVAEADIQWQLIKEISQERDSFRAHNERLREINLNWRMHYTKNSKTSPQDANFLIRTIEK